MRLRGRTAIITGSTKGIGAAIAARFGEEGANIIVTGRTRSAGEAVAEGIRAKGGEATFVPVDVSDESSVAALAQATVDRHGAIDVVVNNAAATDAIAERGADKPAGEIASDDFDYIVKVGLYGPYHMIKHCVPAMKDREGGAAIINISSGASIGGVGGIFAYTCTKGALNALTKQVAVDYGPHGIRCNTLVCGLVITEMVKPLVEHPVAGPEFLATSLHQRLVYAEDVAAVAAFLAAEEGASINGVCIPVDGGLTAKIAMPDVGAIFAEVAGAAQ
jgi:NAD(P)-dependent dehydrogenase (short-subunit alcohol dehydrogenase family)